MGYVSNDYSKKHIMVLYDLNNSLVPKKIFREMTVVGVRFDVCTDPQKLMNLIHSSILQHDKLVKNSIRLGTRMREDKDNTKEVYIEAIKYLNVQPVIWSENNYCFQSQPTKILLEV